MSQYSIDQKSDDIADIVGAYLIKRQAGNKVSFETFAAQYPELREELLVVLPAIDYLESSNPNGEVKPITTSKLPRELVGDYQLKRLVGFGGMGTVYEAESALRSRVALKVMITDGDNRDAKRFEREAKIVAELHHPNIVPVFDFGVFGNLKYMSMRFIDGPNLSQVLKVQNDASNADPATLRIAETLDCNWARIAEVGSQVASALAFAHQHGVLHRDIKPGNLIVDQDFKTWVTDFGLAKLERVESNLTKTGNAVGTLRYMAPEQLENVVDHRTDIYSLGLTLYELTHHESRSNAKLFARHPLPPPSQFKPSIPKGLEKAILKACDPDPDRRFQTAQEFANALQEFCHSHSSVALPQPRKDIRWICLAAAAAGIAGWVGIEYGHGSFLNLTNQTSNLPVSSFEPTLFDLQIGDLVQIEGVTWEVEGQQIYNKQGYIWQEYLIRSDRERRWLCVEDDDWVEVSLWESIKRPNINGKNPPKDIVIGDEAYHQTEAAEAMMTYLRANKSPTVHECRYFEYSGFGEKYLCIENWNGAVEVSVGRYIEPKEIQIVFSDDRVVKVQDSMRMPNSDEDMSIQVN